MNYPITYHVEKVNDRWIRIGGISLLVLVDLYSFGLLAKPPTLITLKYGFEFLLIRAASWESLRWVLIQFRKRFPHLSQTRRRVLLMMPVCWVVIVLIDCTDMLLVNVSGYHAPYPPFAFTNSLPGGILFSVFIAGVQEAVYYFMRLLKSEKEGEELKKENLQTQLDSLKQQVNPHFLFNSLNTLSYLIEDNSERAEVFLNELCKVYRYLLQANEHELTDLSTELQFIRSYFHLLETRYGDCLHLHVCIEPSFETYRLPSLTLQLLVENAVKHNVIDKLQPLTVHIGTGAGGALTVSNNLQRKPQSLISTRVGLRNIATKFRLLGQGDIRIEETADQFAVVIPLIPAANEPHYS